MCFPEMRCRDYTFSNNCSTAVPGAALTRVLREGRRLEQDLEKLCGKIRAVVFSVPRGAGRILCQNIEFNYARTSKLRRTPGCGCLGNRGADHSRPNGAHEPG